MPRRPGRLDEVPDRPVRSVPQRHELWARHEPHVQPDESQGVQCSTDAQCGGAQNDVLFSDSGGDATGDATSDAAIDAVATANTGSDAATLSFTCGNTTVTDSRARTAARAMPRLGCVTELERVSSQSARRSVMTIVPRGAPRRATIEPPSASTIVRAMESPRPVPCSFVVT